MPASLPLLEPDLCQPCRTNNCSVRKLPSGPAGLKGYMWWSLVNEAQHMAFGHAKSITKGTRPGDGSARSANRGFGALQAASEGSPAPLRALVIRRCESGCTGAEG